MTGAAKTWPEAWVVYMLDLRDEGHTYEEVAALMSQKYKAKITGAAVSGLMRRLKTGGFLR